MYGKRCAFCQVAGFMNMSDNLYAIVCKCLFARSEIEMICPCFRRSESFPAPQLPPLVKVKGGKLPSGWKRASLRPLSIVAQTPPIINVHSSLTRRRACYRSEASLLALIWLFREPPESPLRHPWWDHSPPGDLSLDCLRAAKNWLRQRSRRPLLQDWSR
jgi:hypothetical protein